MSVSRHRIAGLITAVCCLALIGAVFAAPASANPDALDGSGDEVCEGEACDEVEICDEETGECGITVCADTFEGCDEDPVVFDVAVDRTTAGSRVDVGVLGQINEAGVAAPATLPRTGSSTLAMTLMALGLLTGGLSLTRLTRRGA